MLSAKNRLTKEKEFERVFKKGKSCKQDFLFLKYVNAKEELPRIGFVVSKKVSKKATERNTIKRKMREAVKEKIDKIKAVDIIIKANPTTKEKTYSEIKQTIEKILKKAKLIKK